MNTSKQNIAQLTYTDMLISKSIIEQLGGLDNLKKLGSYNHKGIPKTRTDIIKHGMRLVLNDYKYNRVDITLNWVDLYDLTFYRETYNRNLLQWERGDELFVKDVFNVELLVAIREETNLTIY